MQILRIKSFRDLWLGQAISQLGDSFYFVIFAFMVLQVTGSAAMVGFVGAMEAIPYLAFGPYAGVVADRLDRRKIMLYSDLVSASVLIAFSGAVLLSGKPPVWLMVITAFSLSTIRVFFLPAKNASIPSLVPAERLLEANSVSQATQSIMPLISHAISASVLGVLYALSPTWFFATAILLNASSFLGSAYFIKNLPVLMPEREHSEHPHPLKDMKEGLSYIKGRRDLTMLLFLSLILNLTVSPFFVVYLVANKEWFQNLPQNLAWFEFSFFTGMITSSLAVGRMKIERVGISYVIGVAGLGTSVAMMGILPHFWAFVLWNVVAGLFLPFCQIPVMTYMQASVPNALRGRVNGALTTIGMGVQPVGLSLGGWIVQKVGLVGAFLAMGGSMSLAGLVGIANRSFRGMSMPEPEAPEKPELELLEAAS